MIIKKNFVSLLYPTRTIRNSLQYTFGLVLFYLIFSTVSLSSAIFGLTAFLLSYIFVYVFNDTIDFDYDSKDKDLKAKKLLESSPLFLKIVNKEKLITSGVLLLLSGIILSNFLNITFFIAILLAILLNVIHTAYDKIRNNNLFSIPIMVAVQFIKYSLGWFSQTSSLNYLPIWILLTAAGSYIFVYKFHKFKFDFVAYHDKLSIIVLGVLTILSFLISIFVYKILLPWLFSIIVLIISYRFSIRYKTFKKMFFVGIFISYITIVVPILSIFILKVDPFLWDINLKTIGRINENIDVQKFVSYVNESILSYNFSNNITLKDMCKIICE